MLIFLLAYLGGMLTIFSPCVLPVLPFIFARSGQSFRRSGLPVLIGMAATFTVLASLAAVGGAWLWRSINMDVTPRWLCCWCWVWRCCSPLCRNA